MTNDFNNEIYKHFEFWFWFYQNIFFVLNGIVIKIIKKCWLILRKEIIILIIIYVIHKQKFDEWLSFWNLKHINTNWPLYFTQKFENYFISKNKFRYK